MGMGAKIISFFSSFLLVAGGILVPTSADAYDSCWVRPLRGQLWTQGKGQGRSASRARSAAKRDAKDQARAQVPDAPACPSGCYDLGTRKAVYLAREGRQASGTVLSDYGQRAVKQCMRHGGSERRCTERYRRAGGNLVQHSHAGNFLWNYSSGRRCSGYAPAPEPQEPQLPTIHTRLGQAPQKGPVTLRGSIDDELHDDDEGAEAFDPSFFEGYQDDGESEVGFGYDE